MNKPPLPWATLRLAAGIAAAVAVLALGAMFAQYRMVADKLDLSAHAALAVDLTGLETLYDQRRIIALRQAIEYRAAAQPKSEILLLVDRQGQVLAGTLDQWPAGLNRIGQGFAADQAQIFHQTSPTGDQRWLAVARELPGGFGLLVAQSLEPMDRTLTAMRRMMLALGGALALAGGVTGALAARSVMGRIARLNALADRVAGGNLSARLPDAVRRDEFGLLQTHVHGMLDRIESLNGATLRLTDHIAHELRTPLNRLIQGLRQIQNESPAANEATPGRVAALEEDIRQIIRMFDAVLDISRAETDQGSRGGLSVLNLSTCLTDLWELYEPLAQVKGITATQDIAPDLMILGDRNLVTRLTANLLDNAIKYCRPGDRISLTLTASGTHHRMVLSDTGPGLPKDIRSSAFDPFTRGARDREKPGHGLGLALVRAIAARHGARIHLPEGDEGLTMVLDWPNLTA